MSKSTRIIKIFLALFLVELMSINSIAAIVSDNDGSAFITKAEFDSLKNNFQSQIDQFNANIDSKIDAAISSYIAGIKTTSETDLSSYIDENGKYGNLINLSWNASSSFRMISTTRPYALQNWINLTVLAVPTYDGNNVTKVDYWSGTWKSDKLDKNLNIVTSDDAGTKKEYRVETKKIGSTNYRMLKYIKVVNKFSSVQFLGFPAADSDSYNGTTITGWDNTNIHTINKSSLTQQNLEASCWMDYFRTGNRSSTQEARKMPYHSVWKSGSSAITQEYTNENAHVFAPFSTTQEYVWDPESTQTLEWEGSGVPGDAWPISGDVYYDGNIQSGGYTHHYNSSTYVKSGYMKGVYFAWQHLLFKSGDKNESGDDVAAKDSIIYNYWDIDDRNWMQKNGLVLGTSPNKDDVEVICNCASDTPGIVYFWCGPKYTVIDNWTSSSFTGVSKSLPGSDTEIKVSLGKVKANYTIWVLFAPTDTSVNGKLKVNRLYYKVEN